MSKRYQESEKMLERALKTIPLGSQTFSKSKTQFPFGVSPYFIERASGCRVWDVDGNEYIDLIGSLAAITIGYNEPIIQEAVLDQMKKGVIFSLSSPIEYQVSELLVDMVPCAEMVRFGKNGSDATAGAVRLARAFTGKDHVAVCGYHGWQDWYIGSTARNLGVPKATQSLTHAFKYNDLESLDEVFSTHKDNVAAVIIEPMNLDRPLPGFLEEVKLRTAKNGAVLVFDEMVSGFRLHNGGAQAYFGVTPDLGTFGKGIANGYPVSALVGKREIMSLMEEVFFSFTFGGETLSLAAAKATLSLLKQKSILKEMGQTGDSFMNDVSSLIKKHDIGHFINLKGFPTWSVFVFSDSREHTQWSMKSLFMQECLAKGLLTYGGHNLSYAHKKKDLDLVLKIYDEVFFQLKDAVDNNHMATLLKCKPIVPLFKLR